MEVVITAVVALLAGLLIGFVVANRKLHKRTNGTLMFDRAEPRNAPYLLFESYDELDAIRKKEYATLHVRWTNSDAK